MISAVEPGFRVDAITVPGESGTLGAAAIANDPAISAAAERVPAGTVPLPSRRASRECLRRRGLHAGTGRQRRDEGDEGKGGELDQLPSEEEIEEEIATASRPSVSIPGSELFDLLGEFIAFSSFPTFDMNGFGLDVAAVATTDPDTLNETMQDRRGDRARRCRSGRLRTRGRWRHHLRRERPGDGRGPSLEFGVVDDQAVVGTGGGIEDLVTEPTSSLADDPQFQAVMDVLRASTTRWPTSTSGRWSTCSPRWLAQWRRRDLARPVSQRPAQPRAARRTSAPSRQSPTNEEKRRDRA